MMRNRPLRHWKESAGEMTNHSVLVVTNMYPNPQYPGLGTFVREQVEGLRARGLDVDVLVISEKKQRWSYLEGLLRFRRRLRARRYDLIHAHYVFSGIVARLQHCCPLVVSFHGGKESWSWVGLLCKLLSPLVDAVTVTSQQHKAWLGRRDAFVVPCGVDLDLFMPMPGQEARRRLGLPPGKKLVLFAAAARPEKRLDIVQAAVELVHRDDKKVELVLATSVPHEQMPLYMNACDVLALASEYEGSPVAIKEAMACNLPIVSVDIGDVAQVIGGTDGCYICRRDPMDMAQKIGLALARGQRTDGSRVAQAMGLDTTVDQILQVYKHVWGQTCA